MILGSPSKTFLIFGCKYHEIGFINKLLPLNHHVFFQQIIHNFKNLFEIRSTDKQIKIGTGVYKIACK